MKDYNCTRCDGTGKVKVKNDIQSCEYERKCYKCKGSGKEEITLTLEELDNLKARSDILPEFIEYLESCDNTDGNSSEFWCDVRKLLTIGKALLSPKEKADG